MTDHSIFRSLSAYWEDQFFQDMRRLRVRDPDTLTRVTEYVPEIVSFVDGIIKNGYAYEDDGSVYFDTRAFDKADTHDYAKLEPWSKGNRELLEEGEGRSNPLHYSGTHEQRARQGPYRSPRVAARLPILLFGKPPSLASHRGLPRGALADQAGTLNVPSWRLLSSGTIWTSILAGSTSHSLIMTMKWPSLRCVLTLRLLARGPLE